MTEKTQYDGDWVIFQAQQAGESIHSPGAKRVEWNIERHTTATTYQFTVKVAANTFVVPAIVVGTPDPNFPRLTRLRVGPFTNMFHKTVHSSWQPMEGLIRGALDGGIQVMELKETATPAGPVQELWLQGPGLKIVLRRT